MLGTASRQLHPTVQVSRRWKVSRNASLSLQAASLFTSCYVTACSVTSVISKHLCSIGYGKAPVLINYSSERLHPAIFFFCFFNLSCINWLINFIWFFSFLIHSTNAVDVINILSWWFIWRFVTSLLTDRQSGVKHMDNPMLWVSMLHVCLIFTYGTINTSTAVVKIFFDNSFTFFMQWPLLAFARYLYTTTKRVVALTIVMF